MAFTMASESWPSDHSTLPLLSRGAPVEYVFMVPSAKSSGRVLARGRRLLQELQATLLLNSYSIRSGEPACVRTPLSVPQTWRLVRLLGSFGVGPEQEERMLQVLHTH